MISRKRKSVGRDIEKATTSDNSTVLMNVLSYIHCEVPFSEFQRFLHFMLPALRAFAIRIIRLIYANTGAEWSVGPFWRTPEGPPA